MSIVAAVIAPDIVADVATKAPAFETLKGAVALFAIEAPDQIPPSISTWKEDASSPPMSIVAAVIAPDIVADVATKAPANETRNGASPNAVAPKWIPDVVSNCILVASAPA